jgi:predicted metal-dependent phosphoesterase TrpH
MSANIKISLTEDKIGFIMGYEYPAESQANSKDTTYIVNKLFGKDQIVEFKKASGGSFSLVTEIVGEDGNDSKKAILRHTYLLKPNTFSIIKDVKFDGTDKWIKRNEYLLKRVEN